MSDKEIVIPLNRTTILTTLLIIAAFVIGALWTEVRLMKKSPASKKGLADAAAGQPANNDGAVLAAAGDVEGLRDSDHVRGNRDAKILLIEYSDFECPFCQRFHPTAQQVVNDYGDDIGWVYRHFPLDAIHPNAQIAAEATECAGELAGNDGFWKLADKLFEVSPALAKDLLPGYAAEVGIDESAFTECLNSGRYTQYVKDDASAGAKAGVTGTPGNILLNTETGESVIIPGAVPIQQIQQGIEQLQGN